MSSAITWAFDCFLSIIVSRNKWTLDTWLIYDFINRNSLLLDLSNTSQNNIIPYTTSVELSHQVCIHQVNLSSVFTVITPFLIMSSFTQSIHPSLSRFFSTGISPHSWISSPHVRYFSSSKRINCSSNPAPPVFGIKLHQTLPLPISLYSLSHHILSSVIIEKTLCFLFSIFFDISRIFNRFIALTLNTNHVHSSYETFSFIVT